MEKNENEKFKLKRNQTISASLRLLADKRDSLVEVYDSKLKAARVPEHPK